MYELRILERAKRDIDENYEWLAGLSRPAADRWLAALNRCVHRAWTSPLSFPIAREARVLQHPVRVISFRSNPRRTYSIIFLVREKAIDILRVRAPGQPDLKKRDVDFGR